MLILHSRWEIRRKMTDHKLSRLQQEEFKIFKEFIRICDENKLSWFICGGSFLGAVRHNRHNVTVICCGGAEEQYLHLD